mmetsp:Transcript_64030/g.170928  ORF Transcript_64030/g.170928 Transcript_64030/m.170928 type:complete len:255 (-) Transcript_64030:69-833(-)
MAPRKPLWLRRRRPSRCSLPCWCGQKMLAKFASLSAHSRSKFSRMSAEPSVDSAASRSARSSCCTESWKWPQKSNLLPSAASGCFPAPKPGVRSSHRSTSWKSERHPCACLRSSWSGLSKRLSSFISFSAFSGTPSSTSMVRNWRLWKPLAPLRCSRKLRKSIGVMVSKTSNCERSSRRIFATRVRRCTTAKWAASETSSALKSRCTDQSSCRICLNQSSYAWCVVMKSSSSCASAPAFADAGRWHERSRATCR